MNKFDPKNFVIDEVITWKVIIPTDEELENQNKSECCVTRPINKSVTKTNFKEFLKNYPRKLERDVCGIYEPPLVTYNDFELAAMWPDSVVAFTYLYDDNPEDYYYCPEDERTYKIVENYEELFKSKAGRMAANGE